MHDPVARDSCCGHVVRNPWTCLLQTGSEAATGCVRVDAGRRSCRYERTKKRLDRRQRVVKVGELLFKVPCLGRSAPRWRSYILSNLQFRRFYELLDVAEHAIP